MKRTIFSLLVSTLVLLAGFFAWDVLINKPPPQYLWYPRQKSEQETAVLERRIFEDAVQRGITVGVYGTAELQNEQLQLRVRSGVIVVKGKKEWPSGTLGKPVCLVGILKREDGGHGDTGQLYIDNPKVEAQDNVGQH